MSTLSTNKQAQRFALLARMHETIFHTADLAVLWSIKEKNTLYTTLKRYEHAGLIHRIYKGLYALEPLARLESRAVAVKALHEYTYITTESVLYRHGYISQRPSVITLVSSQSRRVRAGDVLIRSRMLAPQFLMNPLGVEMCDGVAEAGIERAIADMLYFQPTFHFDKPIPWRKIKEIQKQIGYPLTPSRYDSPTT